MAYLNRPPLLLPSVGGPGYVTDMSLRHDVMGMAPGFQISGYGDPMAAIEQILTETREYQRKQAEEERKKRDEELRKEREAREAEQKAALARVRARTEQIRRERAQRVKTAISKFTERHLNHPKSRERMESVYAAALGDFLQEKDAIRNAGVVEWLLDTNLSNFDATSAINIDEGRIEVKIAVPMVRVVITFPYGHDLEGVELHLAKDAKYDCTYGHAWKPRETP